MDDGGEQIRVVLKPKQKRRSSGSAPGAMPVIPPEADDSPSIPLKQLRKPEPEAMPVRPVPVSCSGNDLPELKPSAERKKTDSEREEDLREMEALQKIRDLERMSPPGSPFLPEENGMLPDFSGRDLWDASPLFLDAGQRSPHDFRN